MHNYASVKTGAKIWIRECPGGDCGHQGENQTDPGSGSSPLGPLRQHVQVSYFQAELVGGRNWPSISSNRQKKWYIQYPVPSCICLAVWRTLDECMHKSYISSQCQKQFPPASNSPWFSLQTPDTPSDTLIAGEEAPLCTRHSQHQFNAKKCLSQGF